jgi:hypothetical protein
MTGGVQEPTWNDGALPRQPGVNDWTPGARETYDAARGSGSRGAGADGAHSGLHQWADSRLAGSGNDTHRNRVGDAVGSDVRVSGRDADGDPLYNGRSNYSNSGMNMLQSATAPITAGINTVRNFGGIEGLGDWDGIANAVTGLAGDIASVMDMAKEYEAFVECVTDPAFDPVQWLAGTVVDFLIQLFQPLEDLVGMVSGNETRMRVSADMWVEVAEGAQQTGDYIAATGEAELAAWVGEDGDAARTRVDELGRSVSVMGYVAIGMNALLLQMAALAKLLRQDIVDLIAKGVSWMLTNLLPQVAAGIATFGATVATAIASGIARVASLVVKALDSVAKVLRIAEGAANVVATIGEILQRIRPVLDFLKTHGNTIVNGTRVAQQAFR